MRYLTIHRCRLTVREPESKETWRAIDAATADEFKRSEYSKWDYGAGEAIRNSTRVLRVSPQAPGNHPARLVADLFLQYGLYDRPELSCWHKGRVVLIGDAAHPTSPVSAVIMTDVTVIFF